MLVTLPQFLETEDWQGGDGTILPARNVHASFQTLHQRKVKIHKFPTEINS